MISDSGKGTHLLRRNVPMNVTVYNYLENSMKNIVILGCTGSIGRQTLDVIRSLPDRFKVTGLAAGKNWRLLADQIKEFQPQAAVLSGQSELSLLRREIGPAKTPELGWGME